MTWTARLSALLMLTLGSSLAEPARALPAPSPMLTLVAPSDLSAVPTNVQLHIQAYDYFCELDTVAYFVLLDESGGPIEMNWTSLDNFYFQGTPQQELDPSTTYYLHLLPPDQRIEGCEPPSVDEIAALDPDSGIEISTGDGADTEAPPAPALAETVGECRVREDLVDAIVTAEIENHEPGLIYHYREVDSGRTYWDYTRDFVYRGIINNEPVELEVVAVDAAGNRSEISIFRGSHECDPRLADDGCSVGHAGSRSAPFALMLAVALGLLVRRRS